MKQELLNLEEVKEAEVVEFGVQEILPIVITFMIIGIGSAVSLQVMGDVQDDMTASSAEYNATQEAIDGVAVFPEKLGVIALVIVAAIIIGILARYLLVRFS